jgi:predicted dithiol-disulfide oxidoreductase (DUF899 family)
MIDAEADERQVEEHARACWPTPTGLDRAPLGRNESAMRFKRHDEYGASS